MSKYLPDVQGFEAQFKTPGGIIHTVNGVFFGLKAGEILGVVGESRYGKSVTMRSVLDLIPSPSGQISSGEAFFLEKTC